MKLGGQYANFPVMASPDTVRLAVFTIPSSDQLERNRNLGLIDPDLDLQAMQTGPLAELMA